MAETRFRKRSKLKRLMRRPKRAGWSKSARMLLMRRLALLRNVRRVFVPTLIGLAMSLTGCATTSSLPTEPARNPKPPQLSEPLPSESYLQQAQKLIESWRKSVTDMSQI